MIDDALVAALAAELRTAEKSGVPLAPIRARMPDDDGETAYAVQRTNINARVASGARIIGRKIGLTAKAVQAQLGVDQPDFGTLFADMVYGDDEEIPWSRLQQPKAEAEVALVLGRSLVAQDCTLIELISAVAYVLPAIEVVGSRIAGWDIKFNDTVADNASSNAVVLGAVPGGAYRSRPEAQRHGHDAKRRGGFARYRRRVSRASPQCRAVACSQDGCLRNASPGG